MAEVGLEKVNKRYGKVEAVKDLNLNIKDKEFFCLLGPSGCGKSSTLRMIAGLEPITSGTISIGGRIVNNLEPKDRDIAMVFENYALYPHMSVYENLSYPLRIRKFPPPEIDKRVREVAELLQITELLNRRPRQLSGGQQQRVGLGRAIVRKASVYLMDEPISHLDAKLRILMRAELKRLQKELDTTTIYVTHDQSEALAMADRVAIMNLGVLQQVGTPDEIFNRPQNLFVAGFVGDPPMNFFDCELVSRNGGLFLCGEGFEIKVPESHYPTVRNAGSKHFVLGIRPGALTPMHQWPEQEIEALSYIRGEVIVTEPLGEEMILNVKVGNVMAKAKTSIGFKAHMGDMIWLGVNSEKIHIFDKATGKAV